NGLRLSADLVNFTLTMCGTAAQVEAAKTWLMQMGELGGSAPGRAGYPGMPDDRSNVRVLPLSSRTVKHVLEQLDYMWDQKRAKVQVERVNARAATNDGSGSAARSSSSATSGQKDADKASKANSTPRSEARPVPMPVEGMPPRRPVAPAPKKGDVTRRPLSKGSQYALDNHPTTYFI